MRTTQLTEKKSKIFFEFNSTSKGGPLPKKCVPKSASHLSQLVQLDRGMWPPGRRHSRTHFEKFIKLYARWRAHHWWKISVERVGSLRLLLGRWPSFSTFEGKFFFREI